MAKLPKTPTPRSEPQTPASPVEAPRRAEEVQGTVEEMDGLPGPGELTGGFEPAPDAKELPPTPGLGESANTDVIDAEYDEAEAAPEPPPVIAAPAEVEEPNGVQPDICNKMPKDMKAPKEIDGKLVVKCKKLWPPDEDGRIEAHFMVTDGKELKDLLAWTNNGGATWQLF